MKAFSVRNILVNKNDAWMLLKFLKSNVNVLIWMFICFGTKWMDSSFKEIPKWIDIFRFIWNYFTILYQLHFRKSSNFVRQKWFSNFPEFLVISDTPWHYLNVAFHNVFLFYMIYSRNLFVFNKILSFHLFYFLHICFWVQTFSYFFF